MLSRFFEDAKVENAKRWFGEIDLTNADISQVEDSINEALVRSKNRPQWQPEPIAPYAEPINLDELIGDHFRGAYDELAYQADRTTNIYTAINQTNNVWKAELEGVEKAITEASDALQSITFAVTDDPKKYYWLSDTFNSSTFIDSKSTVLVDTDYGNCTLPITSFKNINFNATVDTTQAISDQILPGAPLLILGVTYGTHGTAKGKKQMKADYLDASIADSGRDPQVTLEGADTINLASLNDADPSSWFEVEKNWIPKNQPVVNQGVSWVYNTSGTKKNILEQGVTKGLDWEIYTQWPNSTECNKVSLATFEEDVQTGTSLNKAICLNIIITPETPVALSMLDIKPFIRYNVSKEAPEITIDSIIAVSENNEIEIAKGVKLGSNTSATKMEAEVLRRTGYQTTGSVFFMPTDRLISSIKIKLSSNAVTVDKGLAHPWKAKKYKYKFSQSVLGITTSSHTDIYWQRESIWGSAPVMEVTNKKAEKLSGTLAPLVGTLALIGATLETLSNKITVQQSANNKSSGNKSSQLGSLTNTFGVLGGGFLKAAGWIGLAAAIPDVVNFVFNEKRTTEVLDEKTGYDVFTGSRAGIAIRDVNLYQVTYQPYAEVISTKRIFPGKVSKIGLFSDEAIPADWATGDWVSYYFSVDGLNWQPIYKLTETNIDRAVTLATPTAEVYFKAILKGNPEDPYHSPRLNHYTLQGVPAA